jgi:hypothetical protein
MWLVSLIEYVGVQQEWEPRGQRNIPEYVLVEPYTILQQYMSTKRSHERLVRNCSYGSSRKRGKSAVMFGVPTPFKLVRTDAWIVIISYPHR